jgi:hypothetical protein
VNTIDLTGARWRKSRRSNGSGSCVEVATVWRKSRRSNGQGACVEVATVWRKSRRSNGQGDCVEVAALDEGQQVAVRDSKDPAGPALVVGPGEWRSFIARVKTGVGI